MNRVDELEKHQEETKILKNAHISMLKCFQTNWKNINDRHIEMIS